jgi:parallel beta-helix repeat protein
MDGTHRNGDARGFAQRETFIVPLRRAACNGPRVRLFLCLVFALHVEAATYFVAPDGRDSNPGSESRPFRSINKGIEASRAGDTVAVREGVYREAVVLWDKRATSDAPIRIAAYRGEAAVIDGKGVKVKNGLVMIGRSSWIYFAGFEVRNSAADGIVLYEMRSAKVRGNQVHHSRGGGIHASGSDILIEDNIVHDNVLENASGKARQWSQAIAAEDANGVLISKNRVYQNHGEGIDAIRSDRVVITQNRVADNFSVNIYLDNAQQATVDRNFIRDNADPAFLRDGDPPFGIAMANERYPRQNPLKDLTITNNIILRTRAGIYYADSEYRGGLHHTLIAHNTIYGATWAAIVLGGARGRNAGHDTTTVTNNLVVQRSGADFVARDTKGVAFSSNAWWGGNQATRARGPGDATVDPQLVKSGGSEPEDYRLRPTSPLRDAARPIRDVTTDYFGTRRGSAPDIGAHEL